MQLVLAAKVTEEAPPWWVGGVIALTVVIVGAAITLYSTQRAMSRQLVRQDQARRREVYAKYIEIVQRYIDSCRAWARMKTIMAEVHAKAPSLEGRRDDLVTRYTAVVASTTDQGSPQQLEAETDALVKEIEGETDALIKELDGATEGILAEMEDVRVSMNTISRDLTLRNHEIMVGYYELTLYAPEIIRDVAGIITGELADLYAASSKGDVTDQEAASSAVTESVADLTVVARADVGAPGATNLEKAEQHVRNRQSLRKAALAAAAADTSDVPPT